MKKIVFFLFLTFCALHSNAQTPGYMGKRWAVSGDFGSIVRFGIGSQPNHNFSYKRFNFSIRYNFELDYATSRKNTTGLTVHWVKTAMNSAREFNQLYPGENYEESYITGLFYGLHYKFFHHKAKGAIAPVGNYSKITAGVLAYKVIPYDSDEGSKEEGLETLESRIENFATPVFTYTYGKQRVFFNHFVFKTSVEIGIAPGGILNGLRDAYNDDYIEDLSRSELVSKIKTNSGLRLFSYYLINFNLGVGFIIPYRQKVD